MKDFSGKTAIVTGGTGGLGRAVSMALLQQGASVVVTYVVPAEYDRLREDSANYGSKLEGVLLDVTDEAAVASFAAKTAAAHGAMDILVNTVGGYAGGIPLWATERKVLEKMMALNVYAGFTLARAVVPIMLKQKQGAIVNIAAKAAFDHAAGASAYCASKAAALALFDCLAQDLKGSGVRVNSVLPSIIDTEANRKAMPDADYSKWPKPEEIAQAILFLCSPESSVIHGAAVPVFGQS